MSIWTENGEKEFIVRGVFDAESSKVKVLIDGHSVNEPGSGGASFVFYDLVVENIKRVEIIRGPRLSTLRPECVSCSC